MKKLLLILCLSFPTLAYTCTDKTIDDIVKPIDPAYGSRIGDQLATSLDTLGLCDENLHYAGFSIGYKFDPAYGDSTATMVSVITAWRKTFSYDLRRGLGVGIIYKIDPAYQRSTLNMVQGVVNIATPDTAKGFALELLKKQDPAYTTANSYIVEGVKILKNMVPKPVDPTPVDPPTPPPAPSSMWSFRSSKETCDGITGPWGYYDLCPRYYASVADQFGNRIVLACKSENFGIDFRVTMAQSNWSKIASSNVQSIAFGTSTAMQSLGAPYMIAQAKTLLAPEPVADEILTQLKSANSLFINVRSNSGETNTRLSFTLKGSKVAINQLLQYCK